MSEQLVIASVVSLRNFVASTHSKLQRWL